ncbi:glycosyltransferase [Sinomonas sp. R1AF57]|uniref:glycosyltransferase n=1 Tax=Sinomonas sp. R1AF57 TaxID=2020377 RepID=UPI000B5DCEA4|nr:glycosyltransferase [Sinomonas sp. R1AF57]ASN51741.1 hypothetical protein CGQ25_06380 [Sinomonas sp. R1AF57]
MPDRPRIVLATAPAFGHLYPLMPLAEALVRAGADVHIAVGEPFLGRLPVPTTRSLPPGLTSLKDLTRAVVSEFPAVRDDPAGRWAPALFGAVVPRAAAPQLRQSWAREKPDAVVHEALFPAAGIVADELGVPSYTFGIVRWAPFVGTIRSVARAALGDDPRPPWALGEPQPALDVGAGYVDPFPVTLQGVAGLPAARVPIRTAAWAERAPSFETSLLARPAGGRQRVFVSLGTVFNTAGSLRTAVLGAARTGAEVLVACGADGDPAALGPVPDSVKVHRFVPQALVLPTVDAIVHHGGSGTMLAAAQHGIPQLVVPQGADHFVNAAAVTDSGIGLRPDADTPEGIAAAVGRLLGDHRFRDAAAAVATEIAAMPSPDDVARRLLEAF